MKICDKEEFLNACEKYLNEFITMDDKSFDKFKEGLQKKNCENKFNADITLVLRKDDEKRFLEKVRNASLIYGYEFRPEMDEISILNVTPDSFYHKGLLLSFLKYGPLWKVEEEEYFLDVDSVDEALKMFEEYRKSVR